MTETIWSFDATELDNYSNDIKERAAKQLLALKFITQEQCDEFCSNYAIIIKQRSKFMRFLEKFTKREEKDAEDCYSILWVKLLPPFNGNLLIKKDTYQFTSLESKEKKNEMP